MKMDFIKVVVLVVLLVPVIWITNSVQPLITADMAVSQLEDADSSYLAFKASEHLGTAIWLLYASLALVFAGTTVHRQVKTKKNKGE